MTLDELVAQMTNPMEFTRLCNAVFTDIYGRDFQVIDGSRGDNGNDGYVSSERRMLAMHCPVKPEQKRDTGYLDKIKSDLAKAVKLRDEGKYAIAAWTFITPRKLSDDVVGAMRAMGEQCGIQISHQEATFLANELHRREHLIRGFPSLEQVRLEALLKEVLAAVRPSESEREGQSAPEPAAQVTAQDTLGDARFHELATNVPSDEAKSELKALAYKTVDPILEINAILLLCRWFDPADDDVGEWLSFADRGVQRAKQARLAGPEALFHAQKASLLAYTFNKILIEHHYSTLADSLLGFGATPLDDDGKERVGQMRALEQSLNDEASTAFSIVNGNRDPEAVSAVLLVLGTAVGQLAHMQKAIGATARADRYLAQCKSMLMAAKDAAAAGGDELGATNAAFNLANQIRWHGNTKEALELVRASIPVAEKYGDRLLLQKALWLQETLETGEIPDYSSGERRKWRDAAQPKVEGQ